MSAEPRRADPVVSPADTIRLKAAAEAALPGQIDGGWYETDSLAIDSVDRLDAAFIAVATPQLIAALLAVGERDKAEREAFHKALADEGLPEDASVDDLIRHHRGNAALVADANAYAERERDRQQIARLTEALEAALDRLVHVNGNTLLTIYEAQQIIRAVLAGEEDARPAKCVGCGRETPELAQVSDPFIDRRYGVCRECLSNLHVTPVVLRAAGEGDT